MTLPDHILTRMHQEFLLWEMAEDTCEKIEQLDQDPELKERIKALSDIKSTFIILKHNIIEIIKIGIYDKQTG